MPLRPPRLAVLLAPLLALLLGPPLGDAAALHAQERSVERYTMAENEGRLMAYYSAALAFSPVGAPGRGTTGRLDAGLELTYVPPLGRAQRTAGGSKTESTNLLPVVPRPRLAARLPGGLVVEGSWVPPVPALGVTANLLAVAVARPLAAGRTLTVTPRVTASGGSVVAPVTCNRQLERNGGGDSVYFARVCHGHESRDRFEPRAVGGELLASRPLRGGAIAYAGLGGRIEDTRFDVGVRRFDGSPDPDHPILSFHAARGYGVLGASWPLPGGLWASGELFYAPGSLLTVRARADLDLLRWLP